MVTEGFPGRQLQDHHDSDYQSGGMQLQRHSQHSQIRQSCEKHYQQANHQRRRERETH